MRKKLTVMLLLFALLVSGCATNKTDERQGAETPNTLNHLAYCDQDDSDLCVEGFGKDNSDSLLILFKTKQPKKLQELSVSLSMADSEKETLQCYRADDFPNNIYCTSQRLPESGTSIKLDVFGENKTLLGSGNFRIQYGQINLAGIQSAPNTELNPSYPNASEYPNYPNKPSDTSYPNYPNYPN